MGSTSTASGFSSWFTIFDCSKEKNRNANALFVCQPMRHARTGMGVRVGSLPMLFDLTNNQ